MNQASTMKLWALGDIRLTIGQYDDRTIRLIELSTHMTMMCWPWIRQVEHGRGVWALDRAQFLVD